MPEPASSSGTTKPLASAPDALFDVVVRISALSESEQRRVLRAAAAFIGWNRPEQIEDDIPF